MKKILMMALCGFTACMCGLSADEASEVASCGGSSCRKQCGCHKDCGRTACQKKAEKTECSKKCGKCNTCKKPCDKPKKEDSCNGTDSQDSDTSSND